MAYFSERDLDVLFEDPSALAPPSAKFTLFMSLPAEMRNMIYTYYFSAQLRNIKVNALGKVVKPALLFASKELQREVNGYFETWLACAVRDDSDITIEAQVDEYNHIPFQNCVVNLVNKYNNTSRHNLFTRTHITYIGAFNFDNILTTVDATFGQHSTDMLTLLRDQNSAQTPDIPAHGCLAMFYGPSSVYELARRYCAKSEENKKYWCYRAFKFLDLAAELGFGVGQYEKYGDTKVLARRVWRCVAKWHHGMRRTMKDGRENVKMDDFWEERRKRKRVHRKERDDVEMANLVYALCEECL